MDLIIVMAKASGRGMYYCEARWTRWMTWLALNTSLACAVTLEHFAIIQSKAAIESEEVLQGPCFLRASRSFADFRSSGPLIMA